MELCRVRAFANGTIQWKKTALTIEKQCLNAYL